MQTYTYAYTYQPTPTHIKVQHTHSSAPSTHKLRIHTPTHTHTHPVQQCTKHTHTHTHCNTAQNRLFFFTYSLPPDAALFVSQVSLSSRPPMKLASDWLFQCPMLGCTPPMQAVQQPAIIGIGAYDILKGWRRLEE